MAVITRIVLFTVPRSRQPARDLIPTPWYLEMAHSDLEQPACYAPPRFRPIKLWMQVGKTALQSHP